MISAWRLCRAKYEKTAFDGRAAAEFPGRWNSSGVRAIYTAESRSLCCLEVLAHVSRKATLAAVPMLLFEVTIPEKLIVKPKRLPRGWDLLPCGEASQKFGSLALGDAAVLCVPSVVTPGEFCYVLNPAHPDFAKLEIGRPLAFSFDTRVVG